MKLAQQSSLNHVHSTQHELLTQENLTKSLQQERLIFNKDPANISNYLNLSAMFLRVKDYQSAENISKKCSQLNPSNTLILEHLALIYQKQRKYAEIIDLYKRILKIDLTIDHQINYALFLFMAKKDSEAQKQYRQIIRNNPKEELVNMNYAVLLHYMGKLQDAEFYFQKELFINRDNAACLMNYAIMLHQQKKLQKSEQKFKQSLNIDPYNSFCHYNYALLLQEKGNYREAMTHLEQSIMINPNYGKSYHNYGNILRNFQKNDEAKQQYLLALKHEPYNPLFMANLADVQRKLNNRQDCERYVRKIKEVMNSKKKNEFELSNQNNMFIKGIIKGNNGDDIGSCPCVLI